jgi:hypothetical protein
LRVFLLAIYSHRQRILLPPTPWSKSGLKLVCNVNIVYGNLKPENSHDYAQKSQRNCRSCTFMNSACLREPSSSHNSLSIYLCTFPFSCFYLSLSIFSMVPCLRANAQRLTIYRENTKMEITKNKNP